MRHGASLTAVVHDFSGHPFQVQLARHLASSGVPTTHVYCGTFQTPHGDVGGVDTATGFESISVTTRKPFAKYSMRRRLVHELEYGWKAARTIRKLKPDVVVSANVPLIAAFVFQCVMIFSRIPVIFWQQDVYSVAMDNYLRETAGRPGAVAGRVLIRLERWLLRTSRRIVVISDDFLETLDGWNVEREKVAVIENWAPLDELDEGIRPNDWSRRHEIGDDDVVLLYAGTLGLKHHPGTLLAVAEDFAARTDVHVIVASEGLGAEWLATEVERSGRSDLLTLLPFQPYEDLSEMLATADVLMVLLESDAGAFSVPSKVLTYYCAGRAILGAMPEVNLASRTITSIGAGIVVPTDDYRSFVDAANRLVDDPEQRIRMGRRARDHAEQTFDIDIITGQFIALIGAVTGVEAPGSDVET